ncbi:hypothetical protein Tco_1248645 [Tanacetum coccineum]
MFIDHLSERTIQTMKDMTTCDRQKNYTDLRHRPLEFQVGDKVILKVSSWKGAIHFREMRKVKPKKCLSNETLVIPLEEIQVDDKLHFAEEPMEIIDQEIKQLKQAEYRSSKFDGIPGEVMNSLGNVKTNYATNTLTHSQKPHH